MSVNPKLVPSASEALYDRAQQVMPGGCSRNTVLRKPHPLYVAKGEGCYVTDIEGVTRIDFANNMASLIHGHAHPEIVKAVSEQLQRGNVRLGRLLSSRLAHDRHAELGIFAAERVPRILVAVPVALVVRLAG